MDEVPRYTRKQVTYRTDDNSTTQNIPLMYDLINREMKPDDIIKYEADRVTYWEEVEIQRAAERLASKYTANLSDK